MARNEPDTAPHQTIIAAVFDQEPQAQKAIELLRDNGFPLDMLSVLGRVHPSGDDVLGIYYTGMRERVEGWARQGALWGALWGMLAGAAAMFVLPAIGPVFAAGPIVESIVGALAAGTAGAAVGGALGGTAMAGAATLTHMASALHRMGIPQETIDHLHQVIEQGHFVMLLRDRPDQAQHWKSVIGRGSQAAEILELPFHSLLDEI